MYVGAYDSKGNYIPPCTPPHCKNIRRREAKQMNEQDRFKEIAKIAADASESILKMTRLLADYDVDINVLSDLAYQLGYIEGLSSVSEEDDGTEQADR